MKVTMRKEPTLTPAFARGFGGQADLPGEGEGELAAGFRLNSFHV
jgi:hypothetical protein